VTFPVSLSRKCEAQRRATHLRSPSCSLDSLSRWKKSSKRSKEKATPLLLQGFAEEAKHARPSVGRCLRTIALFIVRLFEGMAGTVVNLDIDRLTCRLRGFLEGSDGVRRNAPVLGAEVAEQRRLDLLDVCAVGRQGAIVDCASRQSRLMDGKLQRES